MAPDSWDFCIIFISAPAFILKMKKLALRLKMLCITDINN